MAHVVVENVHTPVMVAARRQLAIRTQVDAEPEAACVCTARLVRLHDLFALEVPHVYPTVVRCTCQILFLAIQRDCPYIPAAFGLGLRRCDLKVKSPVARVGVAPPYLYVSAKADRGCDLPVAASGGGRNVVSAELVRIERLSDGKSARGIGGAVDVDGRGAAAGEQVVRRCTEGEYIGRVC